jgi:hypothetical protein
VAVILTAINFTDKNRSYIALLCINGFFIVNELHFNAASVCSEAG